MGNSGKKFTGVGVREQIQLPPGQSFRLYRWNANLRDVELVMNPGRSVPLKGEGMHWHYHQAMEITYFQRGEGTRFVGDQIAPFKSGEIVLLGENLPHYWHTRGPSTGVGIQWHFPPDHPFWGFPETQEFARHFRLAERGIRYRGAAATEIVGIIRELLTTEGASRLATLIQLIAAMARAPLADQELLSSQPLLLATEARHQTAMRAAVGFLLANFREDVRLGQLLEVTGMSKPTFSRQFKRHAGKTVSEFLQQVRIEAACDELQKTERPVIEIALGCGFSQISFFNRVFRRTCRCNPTEYRERHRKAPKSGPAA
ncbi:MAG TPA: AraC family transcriptional regulator [Opitutaceae bacterium]